MLAIWKFGIQSKLFKKRERKVIAEKCMEVVVWFVYIVGKAK